MHASVQLESPQLAVMESLEPRPSKGAPDQRGGATNDSRVPPRGKPPSAPPRSPSRPPAAQGWSTGLWLDISDTQRPHGETPRTRARESSAGRERGVRVILEGECVRESRFRNDRTW